MSNRRVALFNESCGRSYYAVLGFETPVRSLTSPRVELTPVPHQVACGDFVLRRVTFRQESGRPRVTSARTDRDRGESSGVDSLGALTHVLV